MAWRWLQLASESIRVYRFIASRRIVLADNSGYYTHVRLRNGATSRIQLDAEYLVAYIKFGVLSLINSRPNPFNLFDNLIITLGLGDWSVHFSSQNVFSFEQKDLRKLFYTYTYWKIIFTSSILHFVNIQ